MELAPCRASLPLGRDGGGNELLASCKGRKAGKEATCGSWDRHTDRFIHRVYVVPVWISLQMKNEETEKEKISSVLKDLTRGQQDPPYQ